MSLIRAAGKSVVDNRMVGRSKNPSPCRRHGTIFFLGNETYWMIEEGKFNRLSLSEKVDQVWRHGEFVDSVMCNNYCLMLYNIKDQFVELYLDLHSKNIVWISIANEYDLEKYLSEVHIGV